MAAIGQAGWAGLQRDSAVIFVTVGAQMPFDRLVKAIDHWAGINSRNDVFAQIGPSEYRPANMQWTNFLEPEEFKRKYEAANVIIAHAGTGSIITALQMGKPVLVMPRLAALQETRNDHQSATAEQFQHFDSVEVAWDERELLLKLKTIDNLQGSQKIESYASGEIVKTIKEFIDGC
jgi:UDP-N-acetylglucosamine transferase subunit ALG13